MRSYLTIVKMLFKNMFKRDKTKKSSNWIFLAYGIIGVAYLGIMALMVMMFAGVVQTVSEYKINAELGTVVMLLGCVIVLIFGTIAMLGYLYFSRDTEFFMALPVKTSTIYIAKLTVVYLTELVVCLAVILPLLITLGVAGALPFIFYPVIILASLIVPVFPMLFASIIAIPIMYLVSLFKNKGAVTTIALIIIFALFMVVYMMVIMSFSSGQINPDEIEQLFLQMVGSIKKLALIFYPIFAILQVACGTTVLPFNLAVSSILNVGIFLGSIALLGFLAILISQAVYKRGATTQLETNSNRTNVKANYKSNSPIKALMLKEWRELFRTPSFAFQCLSGVIICPLMMVVMGVMFKSNIAMIALEDPTAIEFMKPFFSGVMAMMIMFLGVGMNIGASTCVTREGQMYYYMKMIPVDYYIQIRAKRYLYMLISAITIVLSLVAMQFIFTDLVGFIFMLPTILVYSYAYVNFSMFFDINRPKLNWVTAQEAVKNNRNTVIPLLLNMGASLIFIIIIGVISVLLSFNPMIGTIVSWLCGLVIASILAATSHMLVKTNIYRLMNKMTI